jgi:phosphatidylserine/phosphatidylglycerophosphate/cardiolipin synthase-like enzyme
MGDELLQLADSDLRELAAVLRARRLAAPFTAMSVQRLIASPAAGDVAGELQRLADQGFQAEQMAAMLDLLVRDRCRRPKVEDALDLVTTGPEVPGVTNRDTGVVVRELFACAQRSVLVAGYAVYQGREVFRALADRMAELPELSVRMFLDVQRGPGDTSMATEVVKRFAERFKTREWPEGRPLPKVFYDPRSLDLEADKRACLHAKCVVVDGEAVFISSANFTEAAQERNIEMGLLVHSRWLAERVTRHFETLAAAGLLMPALTAT